jgi:hypothetical protein
LNQKTFILLFYLDVIKFDIRMPNIPSVPDVDNIYLFTTVDLPDPEMTFYAVGFDLLRSRVRRFTHSGSTHIPKRKMFIIWPCTDVKIQLEVWKWRPNLSRKTYDLCSVQFMFFYVKCLLCIFSLHFNIRLIEAVIWNMLVNDLK